MIFSTKQQEVHPSGHRFVARAFSLMELMIAIVILGMGMIMVASMYPVAWDRARTLTEFTTQQSVTNAAQTIVESLVRVSGPTTGSSSFMGDWIYTGDPITSAINICPNSPSNDTVHVLNLENRMVEPPSAGDIRIPAAANVWHTQVLMAVNRTEWEARFPGQVAFDQRIHPPVGRFPEDANEEVLDQWENELDTRRFAWSVLHRLRTPITPDTISTTRSLDIYYVTLRRPRSTLRYAQQDPGNTPDPCDLMIIAPIQPQAKSSKEDLMFPVPWRVQVQFPASLVNKFDPVTGKPNSTGIPTEVVVPPVGMTDTETGVMLVQMFPKRAQFVDEITGQIYRVVKRRITGARDEKAILTLDREVFIDDIDLPPGDPRCEICIQNIADGFELVRTVWVYPPPVQDDDTTTPGPRLFDGSPPVVGIDIRTVHFAASK